MGTRRHVIPGSCAIRVTQKVALRRQFCNGASRTRTDDLLGAIRGAIGCSRQRMWLWAAESRPGGRCIRPRRIAVDYRGLRSIWAPGAVWCPFHSGRTGIASCLMRLSFFLPSGSNGITPGIASRREESRGQCARRLLLLVPSGHLARAGRDARSSREAKIRRVRGVGRPCGPTAGFGCPIDRPANRRARR